MRFPLARFIAVVLAAAPFAATSARAEPPEPPISNPDGLVTTITEDGVTSLLKELGVTKFESRDLSDGRRQIVFYDGTMPYNLAPTACNIRPGKCIAYSLIAIVDTGNTNFPLEAINDINQNNLFVTMVKIENGKYGAGRIDLIDGGVTRKNLAINIASFIVNYREAMTKLQNQLVASNPPNAYLGASIGTPRLRMVPATPQQMHQMIDSLSRNYGTTIRR